MNGGSNMTLAFELEALRELASPERVFQDARGWTEYVGVVSEEPTYVVTNFTREHRIRQDFFSGPRGKEESLKSIQEQFQTERHVFIGTTEADEALADRVGWEYLPLEEAAESAEWKIDAERGAPSADAEPERDDWP